MCMYKHTDTCIYVDTYTHIQYSSIYIYVIPFSATHLSLELQWKQRKQEL